MRFVKPGKRLGTHVYNFVHVAGPSAWPVPCGTSHHPPSPNPRGADRLPAEGQANSLPGRFDHPAGGFVAWIETQCRLQGVSPMPTFYNVGLSSETCWGTAPNRPTLFPRPDVHERLDRVLKRIRPDVVVSCYGMNDGIYPPLLGETFSDLPGWCQQGDQEGPRCRGPARSDDPSAFRRGPLKKGKRCLAPGPGSKEFAYFGI
ncbi:MAG: hypothetical protein CM1200mP2_51060 [Planctomycetaceae bacterium]|nr:MAG: hypothetical protein CM1200mP2_51060 [Planctomycetaceae bacterium]